MNRGKVLLSLLFGLVFLFPSSSFAADQKFGTITSAGVFTPSDTSFYPTGSYDFHQYYGIYPDSSVDEGGGSCTGSGCDVTSIFPYDFSFRSTHGDGDYWLLVDDSSGGHYFYQVNRTGGLWTTFGACSGDITICSTIPSSGTVVNDTGGPYSATSSADVTIQVQTSYTGALDIATKVCVSLENSEPTNNVNLAPKCDDLIVNGVHTYSFTFHNILFGQYYAIADFENSQPDEHHSPYGWNFVNIYTNVINQSCLYGVQLNGTCPTSPTSNSTSSSPNVFGITGFTIDDCTTMPDLPTKAICAISNVLKQTFNVLIIPDKVSWNNTVLSIRDNAFTRFPVGYVTDFVSIVSTSSSSTLTVVDAYLPSGVIGHGSHVRLDLNHSLDYILNATTSQFTNVSGSSTQTFYQITSPYWDRIVYFLAFLYIMARIFGSYVIPSAHNEKDL